jgi:hypothetical protein
MFSVSSFALANVANILIFMNLNDFCLLPAYLYYVTVNVWSLESDVHITNRCAPWETANSAENPLLQALQFQ